MPRFILKNVDEKIHDVVPTERDDYPQKVKQPPSTLLTSLMKHAGITPPKPVHNPFGFDLSRYTK